MTLKPFTPILTGGSKRVMIAGLELELPEMQVTPTSCIYVLNLMRGDPVISSRISDALAERGQTLLNELGIEVDGLVTVEGKALHLAFQVAWILDLPWFVLRKEAKPYMGAVPLTVTVNTLTTNRSQTLVMDQADQTFFQERSFLFVDDVFSTGATLEAAVRLVDFAGGVVSAGVAIGKEGDQTDPIPTAWLVDLPITRVVL